MCSLHLYCFPQNVRLEMQHFLKLPEKAKMVKKEEEKSMCKRHLYTQAFLGMNAGIRNET